jgi:hypothetical protein
MAEQVQPLPMEQRPIDETPVHTDALPATPVRDRRIPAHAWVEAPSSVRSAGHDLGGDAAAPAEPMFIRRIGRWLLWRAGPATGGEARYLAVASDDLTRTCAYRLHADGHGIGVGPSGESHERFRAWKEDLRDHG